MMNIYLLRHPQPDYPAGVCYGQTDMPATTEDHARVLHATHDMLHPNVSKIYSSPLQRCANLAKDLAKTMDQSLEIHDSLKEMHFGDWEGQPWGDIERTQIVEWQKDLLNFAPPNGEAVKALVARCETFFDQLIRHANNQNILAVTHAGIIRSALHLADAVRLDSGESVELDYGGITHLMYTGTKLQVQSINLT